MNQLGLIPGPQETEEEFVQRAAYCLDLKNQIPQMLTNELPFFIPEDINNTNKILEKNCEKTRYIYDIYPSWVPLFFSNYKLPFWQGGCAWIFQQNQDSPTAAFFQLRQNLRKSKKYLGIYDRDELITHELSHVGRMKFEEPKFEEILSYRSSKSCFRRFFGPIVQSSYESTIFVLLLLLVVAIDFFALLNGYKDPTYLSLISRLLIISLLSYGIVRLFWRQNQFKSCLRNLRKTLLNIHLADAVIYRLTDEEIITFGHQTPDDIKRYAEEQKNQSLRWRVIHGAYFNSCESSDHYDGVNFHNNPPKERNIKEFLKWMLTRKPHPWPKNLQNYPTASPPSTVSKDELLITYVNHSTVLIQCGSINILTDPIWSKHCGPFRIFGPKRVHNPGILFEDLPPIHLVLISHNHYDHMDLPTLQQLQEHHQPIFITGLGNRDYLDRKNLDNVHELDWWQQITPVDELSIIFVPAQHFSMRNFFNKNKTLWGGFILKKGNHVIYFAGDTGFMPHFKKIKESFGSPAISFLPIGAFEPRWFMESAHMSPQDAVKAHQDLDSNKSMAIHFGTFPLSDEAIDAPEKQLKENLHTQQISQEEFSILKPGESFRITFKDK